MNIKIKSFFGHLPISSPSISQSSEIVPALELFIVTISCFPLPLSPLSPLYRIKIQLQCVQLWWQPVAIFPHGSSNPAVCEDIFNYDPIKTTHSSVGGGAGGLVLPPPGGGETSDSSSGAEPLSAHLASRLTTTKTHLHTFLHLLPSWDRIPPFYWIKESKRNVETFNILKVSPNIEEKKMNSLGGGGQ